jgi:hypothetical protein
LLIKNKKTNKVKVVVCFVGEMVYPDNNKTTIMVASRTITPSRGVEEKYFIFFRTISQEVIIITPIMVASTMVAPISAAAPTEEEDEEVYFALTQKGIDNKIMDSPPGPQKRRRHPTKKAQSLPKLPLHSRSPRKELGKYLKNVWWLGQISLYPTLSPL